MPIYDAIGQSYSKFRLPDCRIVSLLIEQLGVAKGSIVADIGAGTGNYSRAIAEQGFFTYAVEPSAVMREQAIKHPRVKWFTGCAENLPLPTSSVDAVICVLAIDHFSDLAKAFREMERVATGSFVILTFDPRLGKKPWLADYFPSLWAESFHFFPPLGDIMTLIEANSQRTVEISTLMLPYDLSDMFFVAGWRRPELYLNPVIRAGISAFALANASVVEQGVKRLKDDLGSGKWDAKYGAIRELKAIDAGYRFLYAVAS